MRNWPITCVILHTSYTSACIQSGDRTWLCENHGCIDMTQIFDTTSQNVCGTTGVKQRERGIHPTLLQLVKLPAFRRHHDLIMTRMSRESRRSYQPFLQLLLLVAVWTTNRWIHFFAHPVFFATATAATATRHLLSSNWGISEVISSCSKPTSGFIGTVGKVWNIPRPSYGAPDAQK